MSEDVRLLSSMLVFSVQILVPAPFRVSFAPFGVSFGSYQDALQSLRLF